MTPQRQCEDTEAPTPWGGAALPAETQAGRPAPLWTPSGVPRPSAALGPSSSDPLSPSGGSLALPPPGATPQPSRGGLGTVSSAPSSPSLPGLRPSARAWLSAWKWRREESRVDHRRLLALQRALAEGPLCTWRCAGQEPQPGPCPQGSRPNEADKHRRKASSSLPVTAPARRGQASAGWSQGLGPGGFPAARSGTPACGWPLSSLTASRGSLCALLALPHSIVVGSRALRARTGRKRGCRGLGPC